MPTLTFSKLKILGLLYVTSFHLKMQVTVIERLKWSEKKEHFKII